MPFYICPNCKERIVDTDGVEGFSTQAPACRHCGFGFLFELLDDYYPAPDTGLVVTDQEPAYDDDGGLLVALTPKRG